jgi:hypothetical protein
VIEEFGGPGKGRTYGQLIKSLNRPIFQSARYCEGFPIYHGFLPLIECLQAWGSGPGMKKERINPFASASAVNAFTQQR